MENNDLYEDLMIRVLDGGATKAEEAQLKDWLKEDRSNQQAYEAFQKIWNAVPDVPLLNDLEVLEDLKKVKAQGERNIKAQDTPPKAKVISLSFLRKIAAVLLPLVIVAIGVSLYFNKDANAPILLSDGTKVWLYQDAQLDYPKDFEGATRVVTLNGEAYFDVAKDATKPFIIEAGAATIKVLGTSFNVQSSIKQTNVIVNSGKVALLAKDQEAIAVELTKGEKGIYENGTVQETINTDKNYRSWQTGIFEFDGTMPITEVRRQLEKYYGTIKLNISANKDCLLEASFNKEKLSTVMDIINSSCGY